MRPLSIFCIVFLMSVLVAGLAPGSAEGGDWPRFRGPNGAALSDDRATPVQWSPTENIVWRTELPGPGSSSPITTGGKVFLTCYTGYGVSSTNPGKRDELERILVCVDESSGKILWKKSVKGAANEDQVNRMLSLHGFASSTPATDGQRVYVLFGKSGVLAFDLDGEQLWTTSVGTGSAPMGFGAGASPIVYKNLVIVNAAAESKTMYAFNGKTGKEVWKSTADSLQGCWGTPLLVDVDGARQELVISVPYEIWGFNPETGEFLWFAEGVKTDATCASVVSRDGIIYCVAGGPGGGGATAVRAGGRDDVTKTHVLWSNSMSTYVPSPVLVGDYLNWVNDDGIAYCLKRESGETVYRQRLSGAGNLYASLVAVGDRLYCVTRDKGTIVLAAGPRFEQLAQNQLDEDAGTCNASPAISQGRILLRSNKYLYCIGK